MHPIYNLPSAKTEAAPTVKLRQQLEHCLGADRASLDEAFGSIRMHVSTQDAIGEHKPKSIGFFAGTLRVPIEEIEENLIDLLFVDGWKDLYLDVLHLVKGNLRSGAVILADELDIALEQIEPYLDYVRNPNNGFISVTLPLGDGMEYSIKL